MHTATLSYLLKLKTLLLKAFIREIISSPWYNKYTRIYNLSSGPHITRFSAVIAKKRKNFE